MKNDLISRQAAIDLVHKNYDTILDFKSDGRTVAGSFEDIINTLPSVQQEQRWIPVSERLPEDEWVLISKKPTKLSGSKWCVNIAIRMADPRSGEIQWRDTGFGIIPDDKVLAWMSRPEPYKENDDGDKRKKDADSDRQLFQTGMRCQHKHS